MIYDKNKIRFQTYSWVVGTTSFRVAETKYKIEKQLLILDSFKDDILNSSWKEQQEEYFYSLVENGLAKEKGKTSDREKEGRQISSSLHYLGLTDKNRILQNTAYELLDILKNRQFNYDNIFGVRNDSFFYIKQFLKLEFSNNIKNGSYKSFRIQPFLAVIYAILKTNNALSKDFFTFILPTIKNYEELITLVNNQPKDIDKYLLSKISSMENYQNALNYFINTKKTKEICRKDNVFINHNSGEYDIKFLDLYNSLVNYNLYWSFEKKKEFILNIKFPKNSKNKYLYRYILNNDKKLTKKQIDEKAINNFENSFLFKYSNSFDRNFFYLIQLSKWKINLEEYFDLNKRFFSLTDIVIFNNDFISLDEVAFELFNQIGDEILNIDFAISSDDYFNKLYNQIELKDISYKFDFDEKLLLKSLKAKYPQINVSNNLIDEIKKIKQSYLKNNFDLLIDNYFSDDNLEKLFTLIKYRQDKDIIRFKKLDWDCDIPTIFEYLIGIFWYKISQRKGDLTEFLNLSLDVNLLPRRFAGGGNADIVYKYDDHHLLIEVTLSDKNTQRKMELEPVSRHLGKYKIENGESHYAVFIAPYLDPNVLVSFRSYKYLNYYNPSNTKQFTKGLKIIPLNIDDLITIINNKYTYQDIEIIFNKAFYNRENNGFIWYNKVLKPEINKKIENKEIQKYKNLCNEIKNLFINDEIFLLYWYRNDKKDKTLNLRSELAKLINELTSRTCYLRMRGISDKKFEDENKKLVYVRNFLQELIFDIKKLEIEDLYCIEESYNVNEYEKLIIKKSKELKKVLGYKI